MNRNIKKRYISPLVLILTVLLTLSPPISIAQPESVVIEGTVQFSETGESAEGAVVWAVYQDERAVQKIIYGPAFTGAAGDYRLEVPAGEKLLRMMATVKGYQSDSDDLRIFPGESTFGHNFELRKAFTFEGRVAGIEPIDRVSVKVEMMQIDDIPPRPGGVYEGETTVAADGSYRFVLTYADRQPSEADFYPNQTSKRLFDRWVERLAFAEDQPFRLRFSAKGLELVTIENVQLVRGEVLAGINPTFDSRAATVAGRVINQKGTPVPNLSLSFAPVKIRGRRGIGPIMGREPSAMTATTDVEGRFRFDSVASDTYQLQLTWGMPPNHEPAYQMNSVAIGPFIIFPRHFFDSAVFGVKKGVQMEDIEITVQERMRIRGRILLPDGTPVRNAKIRFRAQHRNFDGGGGGTRSGGKMTDAEGRYEYFIDIDNPGTYTITVEYEGMYASTEALEIEEGTRLDGVDLTLGNEPTQVDNRPMPFSPPPRFNQWIINPENGHSYKAIFCRDWHDAETQARMDGAHLVTINDVAEQQWLTEAFIRPDHRYYWIGLTHEGEEGVWKWISGESVEYTHWAKGQPNNMHTPGENFAALSWGEGGGWNDFGPENPEWREVRFAIVEKGAPVSRTQPDTKDKSK